jgi:putative DNA primase/helicase
VAGPEGRYAVSVDDPPFAAPGDDTDPLGYTDAEVAAGAGDVAKVAAEAGALADGFRPTDVGNAERLAAAGAGQIRYVRAWQKWIVYRDGCWIIDTGEALIGELAKEVARRLFARAVRLTGHDRELMWKHARRCETGAAIAGMIRLARGIPGVLVEHGELDTHPHLLNVANGTVDLHTGKLLEHDPAHLITKQCPVVYDPDATAPLFDRCLRTWQPDEQTRAFLQRATGSGATGHPAERLFTNLGPGGNGKGKFFGAIKAVLGPYFVVPHKSLLVVQRHETHPTHVASLFGARMLVYGETRDGDRLDEAMIKNLTGGDPLPARRMHEDEWQFLPTHTAFVHSNHPLKITDTSEGIWRRVRKIPWEVVIPPAERDEHLAEKLAAEAPGILNWIIAGAVDYYDRGFAEPDAVMVATQTYREDCDTLARFLAERTISNAGYARARELYTAFAAWWRVSETTGDEVWSEPLFAREMKAHGHKAVPRKIGNVYPGMQLLTEDTP